MAYITFDEDELLKFLVDIDNSPEKCVEFFDEYYKDPYNETSKRRHLYGHLTEYLLEYNMDDIEYIHEKLLNIISNDEYWVNTSNDLRNLVAKLYDHVSLEINRMAYIQGKLSDIRNSYLEALQEETKRIRAVISEQEAEICKQNQYIERQSKNISIQNEAISKQQSRIDKQNKDIKNQSKDLITHTLTVMSIFTAVVFAAITSFDAMTSISAAVVSKFGLWGTLIVLTGMAVAAIDVFYILLRFICHVITKRSFIPIEIIKNINFVAFLLMIMFIALNLVCPQYVIS